MATIQSLVERHTFIIDQASFYTGDKVFIGGHFYSDKPPLPALLGAAVYLPLHHLGIRLHDGGSAAYYLITLASIGAFWMFGVIAFHKALSFTTLDDEDRLLGALSLGFGTLYLSWATTFNNHELAASWLAIGFLFYLKARHAAAPGFNLALAGAFLSLAGAADIPTGVFYVVFLGCILRDPGLRHRALAFLLPVFVTVLPTLAINYSIHGRLTPVQIVRSYFDYADSPWIGSSALSGMSTNAPLFASKYAWLTLVGPHGFLLYDPLLALALWGLVRTIRRGREFYWEAVGVAGGTAALVTYYWLTTNNYGGWSYSIRWFVPLLPLLMFFLFARDAGDARQRFGLSFKTLLAVSILIAFVGAVNPWTPAAEDESPFAVNLRAWTASVL